MSNTGDSDNGKHVEIAIPEESVPDGPSADVEAKPTAAVVPVVPETVQNVGARKPKPKNKNNNNSNNKNQSDSRGRQLQPDSNDTGARSRSGSRSPNRRVRRDVASAQTDAVPLLPMDEGQLPRPLPPLAGPEMDVDGSGDDERRRNFDPRDNRGIDDGFLPEKPGWDNNGGRTPGFGGQPAIGGPFPHAPEFGPHGHTVVHAPDGSRVIPDVNVYQQKKNLAQGMMDLALLSANANQLRYVLESYSRHPYFYFSLVFISTSIICQVAVGIGLIWKSRYNIKNQDDFCKADRINNMVTIGIFLITLVNVLISAFGVAEPPQAAN